MQTLDEFLSQHDAGHLLDIACGGGRLARLIVAGSRSCRAVTGLDLKDGVRAEFLEILKAAAEERAAAAEGVEFVAAPIGEYLAGVAAGRFDTVSVGNALHHIEDVGQVLARLRPALAAGGTVIIQEMHADGLTPAQETQRQLHAFMARMHRQAGEYHREVFTEEEIDALLRGAGLRVRHSFHAANDTPPAPGAGDSPMPGRLEEAVARAFPGGAPAEVTAQRAGLLERVETTGVGTPPQLTVVCGFA